jgi:hypothetical protein
MLNDLKYENSPSAAVVNSGGWIFYSNAAVSVINNNWILTSVTFIISSGGLLKYLIVDLHYNPFSISGGIFVTCLLAISLAYFCEKKYKQEFLHRSHLT